MVLHAGALAAGEQCPGRRAEEPIGRVHPAAGVDLDLPDQAVHHGLEAAAQAVRNGNVVVLSTDTVYGIGADAFNADAVALS